MTEYVRLAPDALCLPAIHGGASRARPVMRVKTSRLQLATTLQRGIVAREVQHQLPGVARYAVTLHLIQKAPDMAAEKLRALGVEVNEERVHVK